MPGKARWSEVWRADTGLDEHKRVAIVSENGWNERFPSVVTVRLSTSTRRYPGPGFPLVSERPRVIAICGEVSSVHEEDLVEQVGVLTPRQMHAIAIGLLEVTQAHRLLGFSHPDVAPRIGGRRRR